MASDNTSTKICRMCSKKKIYGYKALRLAVSHNDHEMVDLLVKTGIDVNLLGDAGDSLLHVAARRIARPTQIKAIFKTLVKAGANVNALSTSGDPPLNEAIRKENDIGVKALLKAGADVNFKNCRNETALGLEMESAWWPKHVRLELLINAGVDITTHGSDFLAEAASNGCDKSITLLLQAGADAKPTSYKSLTAAVSRLTRNNVKCLKLLLDGGADVNGVSSSGKTALFNALTCQYTHILKPL